MNKKAVQKRDTESRIGKHRLFVEAFVGRYILDKVISPGG